MYFLICWPDFQCGDNSAHDGGDYPDESIESSDDDDIAEGGTGYRDDSLASLDLDTDSDGDDRCAASRMIDGSRANPNSNYRYHAFLERTKYVPEYTEGYVQDGTSGVFSAKGKLLQSLNVGILNLKIWR